MAGPWEKYQSQQPVDEEAARNAASFARNKQYIRPGATNFMTQLSPQDEAAFDAWVQKNNVPFDPKATGPQDYDMRGFWKGLESGDPHAQTGVDPNDGKLHYTDYWKTPYHQTFSRESKFATPNAPEWNDKDQLVSSDGRVLFDDRAQNAQQPAGPWQKYAAAGEQEAAPETSVASDMLHSLGSGIRQGAEVAAGAFGDVGKHQGQLASWLAGKFGASPETQGTVGKVASWMTPYPAMPTTEQIQSVDEKTVGKPYEPQTVPGEYARTIGEFLPGTVVGPGGPIAKAAQTIIPAVVSETAGQLTKGTPYEKYARAAAAIVAGAPTAFFGNIGGKGQAVARAVEGSTPAQIDKAERLFQDAQAGGTPITRFEALQQVTNGGTRAGDVQRIVEGKGELRDFFAPRPQQVEDATRGQLDQISPVAAQPSTIGPAVGKEAEGFVNDVRGKINQATEPLYAAAGSQRVDPATFQRIQSAPGWEEASNAIRNDPQLARYVNGLPDDSVGFLNEVQKYLKGQSENAAGSINAQRNMQRSAGYGADASTVRQAAEQASPEFAQAVQTQADLRQRYLDPLMQGPIGKLADKDITTRKAIDALFPRNPLPNSEREISMAVGQLAKRNPYAAKQLVRAHVESAFNQATKELQSGANQFGGAGFVAALKGNQQQAANLEAAIRALPNGDDLWDGFSRYLDILQAQGTRQRIGSQTAFNEKLMEDLSQGSPLGTAASVAAGGGLSWPRKALETAERWRLGRNVEEIARLITDPRAGKAFRSLANAKGQRARNIAASLTLMGASGQASLKSSE